MTRLQFDRAEMIRILGRRLEALTGEWHPLNRSFFHLVLEEAATGGSAKSVCLRIRVAQTTVDRWTRHCPGAVPVKSLLDGLRVACALYIYAHGFLLEEVNYGVGFDSPTSLQRMMQRVVGSSLQALAKHSTWEQYLDEVIRQCRPSSGQWKHPLFTARRPETEGATACSMN